MNGGSNRLVHEKSPYLRQHADNPVDWYPWGEEAFEAARRSGRLIFLSIGYSTCHWCHVMAHESFADDEVAALLNRDYVAIKVDREERPDIDQVYMEVCTRLTGSGGWPLTVILTPERLPVFAGTYFGKESRFGRPGLLELLPEVARRWQNEAERSRDLGRQVADAFRRRQGGGETAELSNDVPERAAMQLVQSYDEEHGGFGPAPKFPRPHDLTFLLRRWRRHGSRSFLLAATGSLKAMRAGGIYDQIGGGFHRYSTDREWLVPHFEKMLYDQAGLTLAYLEAWQATGEVAWADTAREVIGYVLRDLRTPGGAFYSAEDADSEGGEGMFYLWSADELHAALGSEYGERAMQLFGAGEAGNLTGEMAEVKPGGNILHQPKLPGEDAAALAVERKRLADRLLAARAKRVRPHRDEKILTAWNGMMISSLARSGAALGDSDLLSSAWTAATFIRDHLRDDRGRLLRRWADGEAAVDGFAEDYAFFARGLLDLHQATQEIGWLRHALQLAGELNLRFTADNGALFDTADDGEQLLFRPRSLFDGAHASATSAALDLFSRLFLLTGDSVWKRRAETLLAAASREVGQAPVHFTALLQSAALLLEATRAVVIVGAPGAPGTEALLAVVRNAYLPETVLLLVDPARREELAELAPHAASMEMLNHHPTAFVCQNFACQQPVSEPERLRELLATLP